MTTTHDVSVGDAEVVKRFRGAARGGADREWAVLTLLHQHAPGLGPEPLWRSVEDGRPMILMSRLPGEPLGGQPLRDEQIAALVAAREALTPSPRRPSGPGSGPRGRW